MILIARGWWMANKGVCSRGAKRQKLYTGLRPGWRVKGRQGSRGAGGQEGSLEADIWNRSGWWLDAACPAPVSPL